MKCRDRVQAEQVQDGTEVLMSLTTEYQARQSVWYNYTIGSVTRGTVQESRVVGLTQMLREVLEADDAGNWLTS